MAARKSSSAAALNAANETWDSVLDLFIESRFSEPVSMDEGRRDHALSGLIALLGDSLHLAEKDAKVRDKWQGQMVSLIVYGAVIHMRSERTTTSFDFGFDNRGFFFEVAPRYLKNLRHMGDDFWALIVQLTQQENFELVIHERSSGDLADKAQRLLPNKKSRLFSLLREYMIQALTDSHFGLGSFASLAFYWPYDANPERLLQELAAAFKAVWTIDYQLWKVSYQQENKLKNLNAQ